jgi:hypothetical protein
MNFKANPEFDPVGVDFKIGTPVFFILLFPHLPLSNELDATDLEEEWIGAK